MTATKPVANLSEVPGKLRGNGGKFAFQQGRIGPLIGLKKLGCAMFTVPPGKSAFPYHAHSAMEEMCIVLSGTGTLRQDGQMYEIKEGDVIASATRILRQIRSQHWYSVPTL